MYGAGDVRVIDIPDPTLQQPTDALVRVVRACVCGSDLHPYHSMPADEAGTPMGHEFIGVVEELGRRRHHAERRRLRHRALRLVLRPVRVLPGRAADLLRQRRFLGRRRHRRWPGRGGPRPARRRHPGQGARRRQRHRRRAAGRPAHALRRVRHRLARRRPRWRVRRQHRHRHRRRRGRPAGRAVGEAAGRRADRVDGSPPGPHGPRPRVRRHRRGRRARRGGDRQGSRPHRRRQPDRARGGRPPAGVRAGGRDQSAPAA